jgi:tRNA(Ile)-lysidine synthase
VAVSGGQDSLCLLKILLDLQPKWGWYLGVAHCDHQWCYDLGLAAYVENLVRAWGLPFYLQTAANLPEKEAAAREWRYQVLQEIAEEQGFTAIVTAHTQTDLAETCFYNLVRGSGADGLAALTWQRYLSPSLRLVRPLLATSRSQTLDFCQALNIPVWQDEANLELKFARNRLRLQVFPYLKEHFNPQLEKALAQTAHILHAEAEYLETLATESFHRALHPELPRLNRLVLVSLPLALQRRVVRQFLGKFRLCTANFSEIEEIVNLISAPNRSRTSTLTGKIAVEVAGDWLVIIGYRYINN